MSDVECNPKEEQESQRQGRRLLRNTDTRWWLELPDTPSQKRTFSLFQRLFGPIEDRDGVKMGFLSRLTYEWFWTDDPYFVRVDMELKEKGL
ncbi:MAG: hypothetical protein RLZZ480_277 [Candidatus Parcubacteria bacterium]|jgi:hypothetical protein